MSCEQCLGLERLFGERKARTDLRRYRRRGLRRSTRVLVDAIVAQGISNSTVLDIGGGIGAIPLSLLAAGARTARLVEASPAYLAVARREAERQGYRERMSFGQGDFVTLADEEQAADVVTLDRVICCYDDAESLVTSSAARATFIYGLVYPRDIWWNRAGARLVNLLLSFTRLGYRTFVHSAAEVEQWLEANGLRKVFHRNMGVWQVVVYRRN